MPPMLESQSDDLPCLTSCIVCYFLEKKKKKGVEERHQSKKYILTCTLTIRSPYDNVQFDLD